MTAIYSPTKSTTHINVHYLTRVEGHGHIVVDVHNGVIRQCDLQIVEAPRYVEAMLRGLPYAQATMVASRICGICAVAHSTASLRAVEAALGINLSRQTMLLRRLNMCAELLDSHILHTLLLAAPDFLSMPSVIALAESQPELVRKALCMKAAAGELSGIVCGRHTHPIAMVAGGFTHFPTVKELVAVRDKLAAMRSDIADVVALWRELPLPEFVRETEWLSVCSDEDYGLMGEMIASSDGGEWPLAQYRQVVQEFQVAHATAKHARRNGAYMVGALARFNLNHKQLHPEAQAAARLLNLWPGCANPYAISLAQVVEMVHFLETAVSLIDELHATGITQEPAAKPARSSGTGVGACEAPRGTLYHEYTIRNGVVTNANCVIPTAQNLANIEADMRALLPQVLDRPQSEITLALEMLVRAYDPCISCATHRLEVEFV